MPAKLTDKQKVTLWQQHRLANFLASCRLEGLQPVEPAAGDQTAEQRLDALRRQYGR